MIRTPARLPHLGNGPSEALPFLAWPHPSTSPSLSTAPTRKGWIVARDLEIPGAMSQGRTRDEARENVLDALRTVLTPGEELAGETSESGREHLRFVPAG